MPTQSRFLAVFTALVLTGAVGTGLAQAAKPGGGGGGPTLPTWTAVVLDPDPSDNVVMKVDAMNELGDMCGAFGVGDERTARFIRLHNGAGAGTLIDFDTLIAPGTTVAVWDFESMNNARQIVFFGAVNGLWGIHRFDPPADGEAHATFTTTVASNGSDNFVHIAEDGDVIGQADYGDPPVWGPFYYTDSGGVSYLNESGVQAFTCLNNLGQASYWKNIRSTSGILNSYAYRYTVGIGPQSITSRPSVAWGINNSGDVTGWSVKKGSSRRAFLFTDAGGLVDIPTLGGPTSEGYGINDDRYIVGMSTTSQSSPSKPFIYHSSFGTIDLAARISNPAVFPAGTRFYIDTAFDINRTLTNSRLILMRSSTHGPVLLVPNAP
jgi:probable HAF family extracellular repeat protein